MLRETARTKADRLLLEGRVSITSMDATTVTATVRGEGHQHQTGYHRSTWRCSCPARSDACSHLLAIKRVVSVDLRDHPMTDPHPRVPHPCTAKPASGTAPETPQRERGGHR